VTKIRVELDIELEDLPLSEIPEEFRSEPPRASDVPPGELAELVQSAVLSAQGELWSGSNLYARVRGIAVVSARETEQ
jgi:hypothetical protein